MHKNGQEIHLIVSDIDRTILDSNNRLLPQAENAIRKLIEEESCGITFSTGRSYPMAMPVVEFFGLQTPFIYSSGAIFDPLKKEILSATTMNSAQIAKAVEIAEKYKIGLVIHTESEMFCKMNDADWQTVRSLEWMAGRWVDHAVRIKDVRAEIEGSIIRVDYFAEVDWLYKVYQEAKSSIPDVHIASLKRSIEISAAGSHKGSALLILAGFLGVSPENIMAVGDSMNDIHLLRAAGIGVAMGTAPDTLKDLADIVVPGADEGGYLQALDLFGKDIIF